MSMSTAVESIEKGDRIEVALEDAPQVAVVTDIFEGVSTRTFQLCRSGASFELSVERGHTVNLVC